MDITALKNIVSDAYAIADSATAIPRFSTQFTFTDKELLVRIPIYECQPPPRPLVGLICHVINAFWGPVLIVVPATFAAYALLRSRKAEVAVQAT